MNAVPVDVLGNSLRIDVLTVVRIKPSVIVFGIVDPTFFPTLPLCLVKLIAFSPVFK